MRSLLARKAASGIGWPEAWSKRKGNALATGLIPQRAAADAAHIGLAAAHGMDFLLTWNCRHIHNAFIEHRLQGVCAALGLSLPTLCTPPELMAEYLQA